ncbi:DUF6083 domain-containing protein [Streptomyces sp. NPDC056460]|uniref:DUF6083 domain-containing protein n=1 Tax=Streptomyces sp. NPDC056460 TaxID=3345825 RepID=UPI003693BA0A
MRPIHVSSSRHWDGSLTAPGRRALRVATDSPTRLLCTAQRVECRDCGNRIDWHATITRQAVPLHPAELPTAIVPESHRWHVASGIAHHAGDGTPWCRIAHTTLCPARTTPQVLPPSLESLRQRLALRTRRLLDTGAFTPGEQLAAVPPAEDICRPTRPFVQILCARYIAARPVEDIRCVAQTVRRTRCSHHVLAPGTTPGRWTLASTALHHFRRHPTLPKAGIALYDLGHLPYSEQLRWRTQRCPAHAAAHGAPDLALAEWEPFDPLRHHVLLATRLPVSGQQHR